ncbi:LRC71 protein [Camponotus japonicus]
MLTEIECLTDLNLDNNPNVQENYFLLCTPSRNLHYLSLKMCKLSDKGIQKIMDELKYRDSPNHPKLIALNVADNDITDVGAKYIAAMLRTNRSLQSMVLTGNKIRDNGALLIIQELCMSTLTHEEIVDLRRRRFLELESKLDNGTTQETYVTTQWKRSKTHAWQRQNLNQNSKKMNRRDSSSKMKTQMNSSSISDNSVQISEKFSDSNISHPFTRETMAMKGSMMTSGNLELQHLSLSFNRLTNKTLKKLISCLYYQNYVLLNDYSRGLLYVFLEGNNILKNEDWTTLQELLRCRRQENQIIPDEDFKDLVPVESETLRSRISNLHI